MRIPKKQAQPPSVFLFELTILLGLIVWFCGLNLAQANSDFRGSGTFAAKDINVASKGDLIFSRAARLNPTSQLACDQPSFTDPLTLKPGTTPWRVVTEDFNLDGKPDFAVANAGSNNVSVFLGNGMGGFSEAPDSPVSAGNRGQAVVSGDFNHDGKPDLAVGNFLAFPDGTVTIMLGNGDGRFVPAPGSPIRVRWGASSLALGDFNRDGKQDLAVGLADTDHLEILLGNGDGSFKVGAPAQVKFGESPFFVASGEFNGDGKPDLVVTNNGISDETHISVLLGDGAGNFSAPTKYSVGGTGPLPNWLVVSDFNRDDNSDVATANFGDDTISVLLGNGAGGFNAPLRFGVQGGVASIAVADFDLDGKLDLAARYRRQEIAGNFAIFLGNGDGNFGAQHNFFQGDFPFFLGVADFDQDGKPDLVTTNISSNTVSVLLNSCAPPLADLRIKKTASAEHVLTGATIIWNIEVFNRGPAAAHSVVVNDVLDKRATFVSCEATSGGVCGGMGNYRTITFASMPVGSHANIRLSVHVNCAVADGVRIPNTATVKSATADSELGNNFDGAVTRVVNPPPKITGVFVDKPVLWPPNHKLVDVTIHYNVTDHCDSGSALRSQLSVKSNEPVDPVKPDWVIVDAHHVKLRAEGSGKGNGRAYTITITCQDSAQQTSSRAVTVIVPNKSQGKE